jgi:hypothetical protein
MAFKSGVGLTINPLFPGALEILFESFKIDMIINDPKMSFLKIEQLISEIELEYRLKTV